ncbi:helix-turn-helix transcriptional regulator [Pedobacter sp. Hv1]|uniref:helix-turn-helix transcriptional regulator n=1 Tax=Pedobacter sp. Hv1 TaxID=1740090 RepID=UPI0006D88941|nr:AraC family transcriptional regulator [Pedobacter sp. Hv1]KQC00859.1 hypothetical protein AQF98_09285 [Pedobacter sp. Hv1]
MYFTSLPDHTKPDFDEELHFSLFKKHNIIFNAESSYSSCDRHVGCLSFKTILSGEEWYGINRQELAIRPGQFLILNNEQEYSCHMDTGEKVKNLSVFFKQEFAAAVFHDTINKEESVLDAPFDHLHQAPEFFQTLQNITPELQQQLNLLLYKLNNQGYHSSMADEQLFFLLRYLLQTHQSDTKRAQQVNAIKRSTKMEVYKRLCIAKDILHSSYIDDIDLNVMSKLSCLSVPQLVRQFKSVFNTTPYQYLINIRLQRAAELLKSTTKPIHEVTWLCGFENVSAFSRAFKTAYGTPPTSYRNC